MATRTTFIRMTSGQDPVVMMGGELSDDKEMVVGFTDIYGPKTHTLGKGIFEGEYEKSLEQNVAIYKADPSMKDNSTTEDRKKFWDANRINVPFPNTFKRPIPGIKSIDVQFKGGVRALRTANISWTCWSFEDLDRLMTHFLAHGKTVALEWGWVYNKKRFQSLPSLIDSDGKILEEGFLDYRKTILSKEVKGDFDFMVGVIKNFEYTTRDDGGFDCKTDIVSTGVNVLDSSFSNITNTGNDFIYNLKKDDSPEEKEKKLRDIVKGSKTELPFNTKMSLNATIAVLDIWAAADIARIYNSMGGNFGQSKEEVRKPGTLVQTTGPFNLPVRGTKLSTSRLTNPEYQATETNFLRYDTDVEGTYYVVLPNCYIAKFTSEPSKHYGTFETPKKVWFSWKFLEDHIFSKFLTMVSDNDKNSIVTNLQSIEAIIDEDGVPTGEFESTRIRNNKFLQTIDLNKYILPGQFVPNDAQTRINDVPVEDRSIIPIRGVEMDTEIYLQHLGDSKEFLNLAKAVNTNFSKFTVPGTGTKEGYLRNMLINFEVLKSSFSELEPTSLSPSFENLFNELNSPVSFWKFNLTTDELNTNRLKIIDENTTLYDWDANPDPYQIRSKPDDENSLNSGIFYFPVWKHNSIVKSQNITAKIPNAMQLAAMYGQGVEVEATLGDTDSSLDSKGKAAGALVSTTVDRYNKNIDFAYKKTKPGEKKAGVPLPLTIRGETRKIGLDGADVLAIPTYRTWGGILGWSKEKKSFYTAIMQNLQTRITSKLNESGGAPVGIKPSGVFILKEGEDPIPEDRPYPLPEHLKIEDLLLFLSEDVFPEKYVDFFGGKFGKDYKLKPQFLDTVIYLITAQGVKKEEPILIPLDLQLVIDGIGGIYPGNSFHSDYVPLRYQNEAMFQCFDVNHTVDSSGWKVSLTGKMRATLAGLYEHIFKEDESLFELYKEYKLNKDNLVEGLI